MTTDDITEALKDKSLWADGFITRDGCRVVITSNRPDLCPSGPVQGYYFNDMGESCAYCWTAAGRATLLDRDNFRDLVRRPVKQKIWLNIYRNGSGGCDAISHNSRAHADKRFGPNRIACIEIEFQDGEGLQ